MEASDLYNSSTQTSELENIIYKNNEFQSIFWNHFTPNHLQKTHIVAIAHLSQSAYGNDLSLFILFATYSMLYI